MIRLVKAKLTITNAVDNVIYQCPESVTAKVIGAVAVETGLQSLLYCNLVDSGGVVTNDNLIINGLPLNNGSTEHIDGLLNQTLSVGDYLSVRLDDVGSANIFLSIQESI